MIRFLINKIRGLDEFLKRRRKLNYEPRKIILNDQGFAIVGPKGISGTGLVTWAKVNCINVYKVDCFTFDEIRFDFHQDDVAALVVSELMEGYAELTNMLPAKFEGFDKGWFQKVFQPAFALNFTQVWSRQTGIA